MAVLKRKKEDEIEKLAFLFFIHLWNPNIWPFVKWI
jgi:hypothetical protein